jgi:hypothetical protein
VVGVVLNFSRTERNEISEKFIIDRGDRDMTVISTPDKGWKFGTPPHGPPKLGWHLNHLVVTRYM